MTRLIANLHHTSQEEALRKCSTTSTSLATKLGWIKINIFFRSFGKGIQNSLLLTEEHVSILTQQKRSYRIQKETINNSKNKSKQERQEYKQQKLTNTTSSMTSHQCRLNDLNAEWGASYWLTTLLIEGYMLNKQELWNLVNIRFS